MKNGKIIFVIFLQILVLYHVSLNNPVHAQAPADPSSIIGKVVCGYQGWFSCAGDGSPIDIWFHWSGTTPPAPGNLSFEAYPDISIYNSPDLFLTGFANQGDGQPSRLFSSYKQDVIDTHFALMQTHGIDGIALQRFATELQWNPTFKENRDTIAARVKRSAEKYSRLFYVMYDMSGLEASNFGSMQTDWLNTIDSSLHLTSSPMYTKQNGQPVVCIWGFGLTDRAGTASECLTVINWFKGQGCYVIGGVPTNWRTCTGDSKPGFENVYKAFDMISPWSVGRFSNISGVNTYKTNYLAPDQSYCNTYGIAYQPVVFPGFAWSNWNGGTKNKIPRNKGEFLWRQVYNIKSLSIPSVYMAMFDEYDEGTALLSMADGYSMIPTNQYFLTSSADGTYLSPDFYLRLTGKATKVIKGIDPVTTHVTIPFSVGPVYFRTSHETTIDALPNWTSTTESKTNVSAYGSSSGDPACAVVTENPHKGSSALRIQGRDGSATTSYAYFKVFDVDIPVYSNTQLQFWYYPTNNLSRYVSVDLIMTDGSSLHDCGALDINGLSMHPAAGRGTVNTWTKTTSVIGTWLNGKTIDRILIAYDHAAEADDFRTYIDDISIDTGMLVSVCSWTGVASTDWFDNTNWSTDEVPSASTDIFITAGAPNLPVINAAGAICRDITFNTTLTISSTNSLSVNGNWTNNGMLTPGSGTVAFNGTKAQTIGGPATTAFNNLTINAASPSIMVTSSAPAFTVTDNLTVTNGNLILQADNADYNVNNIAVSYTDATHYGTLTHNVPWGSHAVVISGNLAVDGKWVPAVRSFVKMQAPSGSSIQTLRTGDNFTSSTLSGLILETPGGFSPGGTFTLSGTLRVNQEAYILSGLTTGSFHLNGYHAIFSGDFLWNQSGSVYIDAGDGGSSPVLDVIDHTEFDSPCYMSAGTFNNGAAGHSGSMTITGSLTCSNSPVINNSGDWTNNGTFAPGAGTVTFNGAVAQALNGTATSQRFNNVNIVKTAGTTLGVSDNTTILTVNDLTETSGNFTAPATLNINGNATLTAGTFTAGTNTNLKGNWTNNGGSFNHNGGTISMAGSVGQTIGGTTATTFNNLTIDNASGVSLNHANTLTTIVCGTLLINSNKKLIIDEGKRLTVSGMLTNTTPDGLVVEADGSLIAPAGSTAQATVKRNIIAAGGGAWNNSWHFLSTPVTSQEINSSGGFIDTGSGYDFSAWDEPYNIWVNFQNHTIIPTWENVNTDNYFKIGKGYRAAYEQTGIKTFSGTLNVGNIGPISNLNISSGINHSWHLIGNPYSSALIWFTGWTTDKIATVCEIWNGSLKDYSPVLSGGIIPALNGFMAEATYNGASLTIPSTAKIHAGASWYNNTSSENIIKVTVWAQDKQSGKESYIVLDPLSTINFDPDFDGHYIGGFGPKFYSLAGEDDLSVNTLPGLTGDVQIPFVFVKNDASNFSIELDTTNLIPNIVIYLKDKKTGTDTELTKNPVYNFTSADGDNDNRFLMRFQDATSITNLDTARDFTIYAENDVITVLQTRKLSGKITVTDMAGRTVAIASLMAGSPMRIDMCGHTGVFIVSILTSRGISNTKIILK